MGTGKVLDRKLNFTKNVLYVKIILSVSIQKWSLLSITQLKDHKHTQLSNSLKGRRTIFKEERKKNLQILILLIEI